MTTMVSTGAVLATWLVVGAVVWGCGHAVRRFLVRLAGLRAPVTPCFADAWPGVATVTVYLFVWGLEAGVDAWAWPLPIALAAVGWLLALRARMPRRRPPPAAALAVLVLVVWLANLSLGESTAYDSGLYHFAVIDWAADGAVVPGLGNLDIRLSSGTGHLLFAAFVGVGPWRGAGQHVANGFLLALLLVQLGTLLDLRDRAARERLSWRVALLLVPGVALLVAVDPAGRVSSPSLDVAALVFVVAGGVLLTRAAELSFDGRYVVAAGGAFGAGLATRPHVLPAVVVAVLVLAVRADWPTWVARAVAFCFLPIACLVGSGARQAMLGGYPLFPLSWPALGVDWRVDPAAVDRYREVVESWARQPGEISGASLGRWDWLGDWSKAVVTDLDVAPVSIVALLASVLWMLRRRAGGRAPPSSGPELVALLAPPSALLVFWFLTAPDTRFAYGAILLVALGLAAWLMPPPTTTDVTSLAFVLVLVGATAFALGKGETGLVDATGGGPLGTFEIPRPTTRSFVTHSGLVLQTPIDGDRCFAVPLCTPEPQAGLELRGATLRQGFRIRST